MKKLFKHRLSILVLLVLLFSAPGIAALYFYQHPQWLLETTTNKGEFVHSREKLPDFNQKNHWKLVFWAVDHCNSDCAAQLDQLARLRLALGRRLYDVDAMLLIDHSAKALYADLLQNLETIDVHTYTLSEKEHALRQFLGNKPTVFIASPQGDFVLSYKPDTNLADIYKDLKHLLTHGSEKKRG